MLTDILSHSLPTQMAITENASSW